MQVSKEISNCRYCGGELELNLDLGMLYPSGFVKPSTILTKEPLVIAKCIKCGLVQLKHEYNLDLLYRQYWYSSSLNKSMRKSLRDIVNDVLEYKPIQVLKVVVDIGANDGTLLDLYPKGDFIKVAYEPAINIRKPDCDYFINDYFSAETYPLEEKADVITSIAMFYDLPDPRKFILDIKSILKPFGLWVIQLTDLLSMFSINAIDNFCHEHLEYYTLEVLNKMMSENGMQILDATYNNTNGGSLRIFVTHSTSYISARLPECLERERDYLGMFSNPLHTLYHRWKTEDEKLHVLLDRIDKNKETCFIFGASTKGNTLLQLAGIDNSIIEYAAEVNPDKFGLVTAGTNIKIISEEEALSKHPEFFLVLPWHFKENILSTHNQYMESGGTFIFPLPKASCYAKYKGVL